MAFLPGDEAVEIGGKIYHGDDACAGTIRRRQRLRGADTAPGTEKLPAAEQPQ
jgi:hypothetical protein